MKWKWSLLSHVWLFMTLWTVAHQAPLSLGFSGQEYWSGLPSPSPGDFPNPGIEPGSPALQADSLPSKLPGKPQEAIMSDYLLNASYFLHTWAPLPGFVQPHAHLFVICVSSISHITGLVMFSYASLSVAQPCWNPAVPSIPGETGSQGSRGGGKRVDWNLRPELLHSVLFL